MRGSARQRSYIYILMDNFFVLAHVHLSERALVVAQLKNSPVIKLSSKW